jgi:DegV family protein with EDD domain
VIATLNGPRFARALRAGTLAVVREQETLNRINVFPVPDADTGANLAATLRSAATAILHRPNLTVGQTVRAAADGALDGARGNSGAILAQFLHGLSEALGNAVYVTTNEFVAAVGRGVDAAHEALANPVEGTILSVLRAWATALEEHAKPAGDFRELLAAALERAKTALANTPKQLKVLARNGVVDAGAQGFVFFLEGISAVFRDRRAAEWRQQGLSLQEETPFAAAHAEADLSYRYCSEALLVGRHLERKQVAMAVRALGDSLVVAGGGSRLRIHLHTDQPQKLFEVLSSFGTVAHTKIEDMVIQQLAVREGRIALVTDSSCDLPETTAEGLHLVRVPLRLSLGSEVYLDGVDITPGQLYRRLAEGAVTAKTSQPAVGDFRRIYRELLEHHEGVLSLHLSSGLSGTFQAAQAAAREVNPSLVRVVDSRHLSVTLGLVVAAVGEALAAGADLREAEETARSASRATRLFATFPSLATAVRGGRVSPATARVARVFGLKPILTLDEEGRVAKAGVRGGFASALRSIVSQAAAWAGHRPARAMLAHANAIGAAEYIAERLCTRAQIEEIPIVNLAAVLAAHTGPGAVGLAIQRLDP